MAKASASFTCTACGAAHKKWAGQCEACGAWNTVIEEAPLSAGPKALGLKGRKIPLTDLATKGTPPPRAASGMDELDRVLGGGLVAASAIAIYGMAMGPEATRRAIKIDPMAIAAAGVVLAALAGLLSMPFNLPFLTGLWTVLHLGETEVDLSTPMFFDIGVYFVVLGTISASALGLAGDDEEGAG